MSNKRRKRTDAEFFVYTSGIDVPKDVSHILISPSVKVLPQGTFRGLGRLTEVIMSEGLREILWEAWRGCQSLERVHFPSTLFTISNYAFLECTSLTTLYFLEGLVEISEGVFQNCSSMTRIFLPRTVTTIGDLAFLNCALLEEVTLNGIQTIGSFAFQGCALEELALPATLTKIGRYAFRYCRLLRLVTLSGGIQLIERHAFLETELLNHVEVTPKSLVVTRSGENYTFSFTPKGTIVPHSDLDRFVIASECFHSMSPVAVSALKIDITEILEMPLRWDERCERLRGLLYPHERRRKEEVTTILELGLWNVEMRRLGGTEPGTRELCRQMCRAEVVIKNVLPFL